MDCNPVTCPKNTVRLYLMKIKSQQFSNVWYMSEGNLRACVRVNCVSHRHRTSKKNTVWKPLKWCKNTTAAYSFLLFRSEFFYAYKCTATVLDKTDLPFTRQIHVVIPSEFQVTLRVTPGDDHGFRQHFTRAFTLPRVAKFRRRRTGI